MTKKLYILLILALGTFIAPSVALACGGHCKKETKYEAKTKKQNSYKKECCKNKQNSPKHKGCKDHGGGSSCHCTNIQVTFFLPIAEINYQNGFISSKKQKFYDKEIHLSSGFYSIWTPPNIA